jgi:hypothetical protein
MTALRRRWIAHCATFRRLGLRPLSWPAFRDLAHG